eukprot:CAMPEP_0173419010 /NCGR_PEP_ID=MMETSP1357-20121228/993_1 /TAXON_ID=77926 /ORGANISM="Hemiselmis rufescens, Strain PCC563" /LENGTH=45 /DNA_ID= /DNA_START= /DNA_END= /DNA_ORIENTATION=
MTRAQARHPSPPAMYTATKRMCFCLLSSLILRFCSAPPCLALPIL